MLKALQVTKLNIASAQERHLERKTRPIGQNFSTLSGEENPMQNQQTRHERDAGMAPDIAPVPPDLIPPPMSPEYPPSEPVTPPSEPLTPQPEPLVPGHTPFVAPEPAKAR